MEDSWDKYVTNLWGVTEMQAKHSNTLFNTPLLFSEKHNFSLNVDAMSPVP